MKKTITKSNAHLTLKASLIILILVFLNGCFSVKPTASKSGKKYYETFFVGEEGTQYYIKPITFKNVNSDESLIIDFTFRYKNKIKDSSIVNFSIISTNIYKSLDSLKISNNNTSINSNLIELLFNEKSKDKFTSRFSTNIPLSDIKQLFNDDNWIITTYTKEKTNTYQPNSKAKKIIRILKEKVFIIM